MGADFSEEMAGIGCTAQQATQNFHHWTFRGAAKREAKSYWNQRPSMPETFLACWTQAGSSLLCPHCISNWSQGGGQRHP